MGYIGACSRRYGRSAACIACCYWATFDSEGAALTYAIVFAAGSLPVTQTGNIMYMNFTAVHPNGTMDAELASAIANLGKPPI